MEFYISLFNILVIKGRIMSIKNIFKKAIVYRTSCKINLIGERDNQVMFEVKNDDGDNGTVIIKTIKGANIITCSCKNSGVHSGNTICVHKIATLDYYQSKLLGLR